MLWSGLKNFHTAYDVKQTSLEMFITLTYPCVLVYGMEMFFCIFFKRAKFIYAHISPVLFWVFEFSD